MTIFHASTIAFLAASKVGFKIAESKKWLPKFVYHKRAMDYLKSGNLEKARHYNSIALEKNAHFDRALVVRDLIHMNLDAKADALRKKIKEEKEHIVSLKKRQQRHKAHLRLAHNKVKWQKGAGLLLFVPFVAGLFSLSRFQEDIIVLLCGLLVTLGLLLYFYNRMFLYKKQVENEVVLQEIEASLQSLSFEISSRSKSLEKSTHLLNELLKLRTDYRLSTS